MVGSTSGASADPDINFPIISGESTRIINNTEYDLGMSFTNGYARPEIGPDSGSVIYIDNRGAITRAGDQIEDIKIVIRFKMPQNTNLNIAPYFDDFDKDKNFYRVLFRPGYPIPGERAYNDAIDSTESG